MHGVNNPRNTEWNNEMVTATDHVTPEWKPSECRGTHMHILKNGSALCRAKKTNPNDEWKYAVWLVSCRVNAVAKSHTVWKPERLKREQSAGWRWTKRSIKWNRCCCTLLHVSEHAVSLFITLFVIDDIINMFWNVKMAYKIDGRLAIHQFTQYVGHLRCFHIVLSCCHLLYCYTYFPSNYLVLKCTSNATLFFCVSS